MNGMTKETCSECDETWAPYFKWSPARFQKGMLSPLKWKMRKWGTLRKWSNTVIMPIFQNAMQLAVAKVIGRKYISTTVQK
jgi:hypothetical protein